MDASAQEEGVVVVEVQPVDALQEVVAAVGSVEAVLYPWNQLGHLLQLCPEHLLYEPLAAALEAVEAAVVQGATTNHNKIFRCTERQYKLAANKTNSSKADDCNCDKT